MSFSRPHWEVDDGKQGLQTWSRIKARVGLECDCHARKCIKISEQSAKILIPTVLTTQASYQTGREIERERERGGRAGAT